MAWKRKEDLLLVGNDLVIDGRLHALVVPFLGLSVEVDGAGSGSEEGRGVSEAIRKGEIFLRGFG